MNRFPAISLLASALMVVATLAAADETAVPAPPATTAVASPSTAPAAGPIDCLEVEQFKISTDKVAGQTDRAAAIPVHNLELIQADIVRALPKMTGGKTAVAVGTGSCPNPETAAIVGGDVLDFRKGNMALRYFVGFGAGSQKVRVRVTVSRKSAGAAIGAAEIADTKWGGLFGGTNTKGLADFAEKASRAVAKLL
jgi:hypothetical protein